MNAQPFTQLDMTAVVRNATQNSKQQAEAMPAMMKALGAAGEALQAQPHFLMEKQQELAQQHMALAASFMEALQTGSPMQDVVSPDNGDRRFNHEGWQHPVFSLMKQSYLLGASWMNTVVSGAEGLDPKTKHQATFFTQMLVDAMSPSNNPMTNPEVIEKARETGGESLRQGMVNWLQDTAKGGVQMTDMDAFDVGGNIACTKGSVVYQNRLIELLEYAPTTGQVKEIPILICPPWINRYYILDLSEKNSLVKYLVDQGFRVFMMSWKNPDETYRDVGFEDYMQEGLLAAMGVVQSICDVKKINLAGYCIGGTLMAHTLAYLAAAKKDIVQSATFMTTMTDYTNTGDLGVFIDEEQLAKLDAKMSEKGYLDGAEMAGTFSALRSADLYWGFVVNQYMLGEKPSAFDILFWNANATRMPFKMHSWYLRELYLNNSFAKGNVTMLGEKLDMGKIAAPIYMVGAQSDHITPWQSCYQGLAKMGSTSKRFALTKAGHVAGVCNPPTPEGKPVKRSFMVADAKAPLGEAWSATAETKPDSWWPDWKAWLADQSGKDIAAPKSQGGNGYKILGAAPGTYVKE